MTTNRKAAPIAAAVLSALLAACGGGDDSSTTVSSSSSAAASSTSSAASSASSAASSAASSSTASSTASSSAASSTSSAAASILTPANNATGAYVDTTLKITFDSAPSIGSSGYIYVYKSDGTLVDKLSLNVFSTGSWADDATASTPGITGTALSAFNTTTLPLLATPNTEVDKIGNVSTLTQYRWVLYRPVTVSGNTATIKLHDNKLAANTSYYVLMDAGVLTGKISGADFNGISSKTVWAFTTKAAPSSSTEVTVDDDGTADFRTVQGALNWLMTNCGGTSTDTCNSLSTAKTITVKNGTYNEMLFARSINNLVIQGESRAGAIVQYDMYNDFNPGTGGSATLANLISTNLASGKAQKAADGLYRAYLGGGRPVLLVEGADLLKLTNFTLQNTHVKNASYNNQAETIYFNSASTSGSRLSATYMNFYSTQDTIQTKGWAWFYDSYIKGDVDFIWGSPYAALFENSTLHTVADTTDASKGGYIFQSRSAWGYPGFVVLNSTLTADAAVPTGSTYLARSVGASKYYYGTGYCGTTAGVYSAYVGTSLTGNDKFYCDTVAYINTKMGTHVATVGWYDTPNLTSSASQGYRESGTMNAAGSTLDVSGRTNGLTSADLSAYNTRTKVFSQWGVTSSAAGTGWVPTP